jgi:hypothetical protein
MRYGQVMGLLEAEAEINNFYYELIILFLQDDVIRFKVSVYDSFWMDIIKPV